MKNFLRTFKKVLSFVMVMCSVSIVSNEAFAETMEGSFTIVQNESNIEFLTEPEAESKTESTAEPTVEPTAESTAEPTVEPTTKPTAESTAEPTVEPTAEPTVEPAPEPTAEPADESLSIDYTKAIDENPNFSKGYVMTIDGDVAVFKESDSTSEDDILLCVNNGQLLYASKRVEGNTDRVFSWLLFEGDEWSGWIDSNLVMPIEANKANDIIDSTTNVVRWSRDSAIRLIGVKAEISDTAIGHGSETIDCSEESYNGEQPIDEDEMAVTEQQVSEVMVDDPTLFTVDTPYMLQSTMALAASSTSISFTSHDDRETIPYATTKVTWSAFSGASKYKVTVKELDGVPSTSDNESGTKIFDAKSTTNKYISISKTYLTPNTWLKVYVDAVNSSGKNIGNGWIYLYVDSIALSEPEFTSHDDRDTVTLTTDDEDFKVSWSSVANAEQYDIRVKVLNGSPAFNDNETGTLIVSKTTTSKYVYIDKSDLKDGKWIKIWVEAQNKTLGATPAASYIYLLINIETEIVPGNPYITSHDDRDVIGWDSISSSLKFTWSAATNAHHYQYTVKKLDGEPVGGDDEAGTIIKSSSSTTSTSVSVSKSLLTPGSWLKIAIVAVSSTNSYSAWDIIYVYIDEASLPVPYITSHDDRDILDVGSIASIITIKWMSVTNAEDYWYVIKLLDGNPSNADDETGTIISQNKNYTSTSVSINKNNLDVGRWLKIWVQANGSTGYKSSADYIYLYIDESELNSPDITSHYDQEVLSWNSIPSSMAIQWSSVENASYYTYTVKELSGEPVGGDDEPGTVINQNRSYSGTSISISKSQLTPQKWLKIAVAAVSSSGKNSKWDIIYVYIDNTLLDKPRITSHLDGDTVYLSQLNGSLSFSWKGVLNASSYWYVIKQLQGEPSYGENEDGSIIGQNQTYSGTSVSVTTSKLTEGKWLKLWVQANGKTGYSVNSDSIYIYIDNTAVGDVIYTGYTPSTITTVDLANISSGLTINWKATNATSYTYKAILMKDAPVGADNESAKAEAVLYADAKNVTSLTIPKSKLKAGYYVKLAVHAYGANGKESGNWPWIGFKITDDAPSVGDVIFDDYSPKSIIPISINDYVNGLTVSWNSSNATKYTYKAILMDHAPTGADNESSLALKTIVSDTKNVTSYRIPRNELLEGYYIKLAVHAFDDNGNESSNWPWIGFKLIGNSSVGNVIYNGYTSGTVSPVDLTYLGDSFTISWNADGANKYTYKAILLDYMPTGADNESANAIKVFYADTDSSTSLSIAKKDLVEGKYLKVAVHAYSEDGSESPNWPWVGFSITKSQNVASYDADKAIQYAITYNGKHPGSAYNSGYTVQSSDCVNFVSQCLVETGYEKSRGNQSEMTAGT